MNDHRISQVRVERLENHTEERSHAGKSEG
jgi:hypothetical protein